MNNHEINAKRRWSFDGEPCDPVQADFIFLPYRDTWY